MRMLNRQSRKRLNVQRQPPKPCWLSHRSCMISTWPRARKLARDSSAKGSHATTRFGEAAARQEELLSTGQAKYDEFVSAGKAKHDALIAEADALVAEAQQKRGEVLAGLGSERGVLQKRDRRAANHRT